MSARAAVALLLLPTLLLGGAAAAQEQGAAPARARPQLDAQALERRARGTFDLGLEALRGVPHGNAVVSPQAIAQALALVYAAAGGETAAELGRVLRVTGPRDDGLAALNALDQALAGRGGAGRAGGFRLRLASAVWVQEGRALAPDYVAALATHFGVEPRRVDFAGDLAGARATINRWSRDATGPIDDLVRTGGGVTGGAGVVVTSAAAFDAAWRTAFPPGATAPGRFGVPGAGERPSRQMNVSGPMATAVEPGLRALDMPFANDDLRLLVLVPEGEVGALERSLTADHLARITARLRAPLQQANVYLPRVAVSTRADLRDALQRANLRRLFAAGADLSGLGEGELRVGALIHDARVDLNEAGVGGAAGVAAPVAMQQQVQDGPAAFLVDRPFLFIVRDRVTGAALFIGRVVDPR
ncbi:MAG: hypothetical protein KF878_20370 [Planctomycetes bacterium]|nr:hypothetical protein [Planctomycetota bacterium]